jgi:hypothetical protein
MLVFDIPFQPPDGTWRIETPSGHGQSFQGRHQAVQFAAREAARLALSTGGAYLSIEGEDGRWRLFGPDLKAPTS